jgi:CBS domain containing-hemolysin-like protein
MTSADSTNKTGTAFRTAFGVVLFAVWAVMTFLWFYDAIHALVHGEPALVIKAVVWLLLMLLLAGMEGLEVAVIDRWSHLYPERSTSDLAAWLAARQLFVALIVVAATQLAERHSIAIPFVSTEITGALVLKIFNLVWTTLTVLWFMQIFPKHMAATNADRYLKLTRPVLSPFVTAVQMIGISWPAEKTAKVVQNLLDWHPEPTLEKAPSARGAVPLATAWAALTPEEAPAAQRTPEDPARWSAGS